MDNCTLKSLECIAVRVKWAGAWFPKGIFYGKEGWMGNTVPSLSPWATPFLRHYGCHIPVYCLHTQQPSYCLCQDQHRSPTSKHKIHCQTVREKQENLIIIIILSTSTALSTLEALHAREPILTGSVRAPGLSIIIPILQMGKLRQAGTRGALVPAHTAGLGAESRSNPDCQP